MDEASGLENRNTREGVQGSNPCPAAVNKRIWPYSISVSTGDSQSSEPGSIPGRAAPKQQDSGMFQ